jgi:hypothetical protein
VGARKLDSEVQFRYGNGDGTLQPPVAVSVRVNPTGLEAGDFDLDGGKTRLDPLCQRLGLEAIHILRAIYKNTKASSGARVNAAAMVLERGYGKIAQAQAVAKPQETQGDLDNLTDSDILAALKRLAGREVVQGKAAAQSNTH